MATCHLHAPDPGRDGSGPKLEACGPGEPVVQTPVPSCRARGADVPGRGGARPSPSRGKTRPPSTFFSFYGAVGEKNFSSTLAGGLIIKLMWDRLTGKEHI